jgi:hypothetical protein
VPFTHKRVLKKTCLQQNIPQCCRPVSTRKHTQSWAVHYLFLKEEIKRIDKQTHAQLSENLKQNDNLEDLGINDWIIQTENIAISTVNM